MTRRNHGIRSPRQVVRPKREALGAEGRGVNLRVMSLIDHLAMGGAEMLLSHFASGAASVGIEFSVVCLAERDGNPAAVPLRRVGVEPIVLTAPERLGPQAVLAVRRHLQGARPDLLHVHLGSSCTVGPPAARSVSIPAVATLHTPVGGGRAALTKQRLAAASCRWGCARVIAVSEYTRRAYLDQRFDAPERVVTIPNGIDIAARPGAGQQIRAELGIPPNDDVVAMVSALRPEKRHLLAVEAFAHLRKHRPRSWLIIVGDGPQRAAILERTGDERRILMLGARSDVMPLLDAADVFLHPSAADLFPTTVLEAMAAAVPVVATAVGGIPEQVVHEHTGVLVEPCASAAAVADAVGSLLADRGRRRRLGIAGRARYEKKFTSRPWLEATRQLYDEVLSERRHAPRLGMARRRRSCAPG